MQRVVCGGPAGGRRAAPHPASSATRATVPRACLVEGTPRLHAADELAAAGWARHITMIEHEEWLPPGHCAALAGCSTKTVLHAIACGILPARRFNRRVILVNRRDLIVWIRAAEEAARSAIVLSRTSILSGATGSS